MESETKSKTSLYIPRPADRYCNVAGYIYLVEGMVVEKANPPLWYCSGPVIRVVAPDEAKKQLDRDDFLEVPKDYGPPRELTSQEYADLFEKWFKSLSSDLQQLLRQGMSDTLFQKTYMNPEELRRGFVKFSFE